MAINRMARSVGLWDRKWSYDSLCRRFLLLLTVAFLLVPPGMLGSVDL